MHKWRMTARRWKTRGEAAAKSKDFSAYRKNARERQVAYESQTLEDPPRGGSEVERFLGIPEDSKITRQRMIVIGNGPNIEMFQFENTSPSRPLDLEDYGYNHRSFYTDDIKAAFEKMKIAGGEQLSEIHENTRYEDTEGNGTDKYRTPWGSLIEIQTKP